MNSQKLAIKIKRIEIKKQKAFDEVARLSAIEEDAKQYLKSIKGFYLDIFYSPILKLLIIFNIQTIRTGITFASNYYLDYSKKIKKLKTKLEQKIEEEDDYGILV